MLVLLELTDTVRMWSGRVWQVAFIWAAASVLIQYIYSDLSFKSPFVLTYICTSLFVVYLPWIYTCGRVGLATNPAWDDAGDYVTIGAVASPTQGAQCWR
jgi:hypothetical protein